MQFFSEILAHLHFQTGSRAWPVWVPSWNLQRPHSSHFQGFPDPPSSFEWSALQQRTSHHHVIRDLLWCPLSQPDRTPTPAESRATGIETPSRLLQQPRFQLNVSAHECTSPSAKAPLGSWTCNQYYITSSNRQLSKIFQNLKECKEKARLPSNNKKRPRLWDKWWDYFLSLSSDQM